MPAPPLPVGRVVVIGGGRAGSAVAAALRVAGVKVEVLGRSAGLDGQVRAAAVADVVVIAVPDDAISEVTADLGTAGAFGPGQLVVHLAGSRGLDVLAPAAATGALVAAVHPAMALDGGPDDGDRLRGCAVGLTTGPLARRDALALVEAFGGRPVVLDEVDRPRWHAALCSATNFSAALVVDGAAALSELGIDEPLSVLRPLVEAGVASALDRAGAGLTGPAARADIGTIEAHLGVLDAPRARRYGELSALTAGQAAAAAGRLRSSRLVTTREELRAALALAPRPRALVMTLGALHAGHLDHVTRARALVGPGGSVVLSIFLNPLQFGSSADLDRYPRTLDTDVALAVEAGVDLVFAPTVVTMYPAGPPVVTPDPGPLGRELEGAARPGHFAGVLTVVHRMLRLVEPDLSTFGEKDYQQLTLVRRLVADLGPEVAIVAVPTSREPDGLARSSRNARLDEAARRRASAIPRALAAGAAAGAEGEAAVLDAAGRVLAAAMLDVDYLELRGPDLGPPTAGPTRLLVAVTVDGTRLLDNVAVDLTAVHPTPDTTGRSDLR